MDAQPAAGDSRIDLADELKFLFRQKASGHDAEALLLTCIDFRYFGLVANHVAQNNLVGNYDHVILAGGTLGPLVDFPPEPKLHWQQFFLEHLLLSKALHNISRVVVLDHRDCGAYKQFGLLPDKPTQEQEFNAHKAQAIRLECLIRKFIPALAYSAYLLELPCGEEPLQRLQDRKDKLRATPLV